MLIFVALSGTNLERQLDFYVVTMPHLWTHDIIFMYILCVHAVSPGGVADVIQRTRRDGKEEQNEDGESHVIPSFQNAFNEALFSASVSVFAAQNGEYIVASVQDHL